MTAITRTPVVPEAAPVGALSAQLRRPRPWSAPSAIRRYRPSAVRKKRSSADGSANGSSPTLCCPSRSLRYVKRAPISGPIWRAGRSLLRWADPPNCKKTGTGAFTIRQQPLSRASVVRVFLPRLSVSPCRPLLRQHAITVEVCCRSKICSAVSARTTSGMNGQHRQKPQRRARPKIGYRQWGRNIDAGLPQPGQGQTTEAGAAGSRPWAEFRLAVVGHLVVCADRGQLRAELKLLAAKKWKHPISGSQVTFGYSTIERWYYMVLNNPDFRLGTLSKKRCDAGLPRSLSKQVCHYLASQAKWHSSWSYGQHHRTLVRHMKAHEWGPPPGYSTVQRYLKSLCSSQSGTPRSKNHEVGGVGGSPEKNADRRIDFKPAAKSPGASRKDRRTSIQVCKARAETKRLTFFLVSGTINPQAARNPSFALVLAFRRPLSNGGKHHTGDMARLDSGHENDARFPNRNQGTRDQGTNTGDLPQPAEYL